MKTSVRMVWVSRHFAVMLTGIFCVCWFAHAGGLFTTKKDGTTEVKSPIISTKHVSTEGLIPAGTSPGAPAPQQKPETPAGTTPESAGPAQVPSEYTLGPGDLLNFQSFDDPTLTRDQVLILYDGTISLPLIKQDLQVSGKTRAQAESIILEAYKAVFKEPQLTISVRSAASKYYFVLGDVERPSKFPYEGKINVLEAVNIAGGLRITQRSGGESYAATTGTLSKAFIIRSGAAGREVIELDLRGLTKVGPHPSETPILPGDVLYIPENVNLVYILGEVRQPSVFQLYEGQTLLQVLTQAGGFNESAAKMREIVIIRPVDSTHSDVMLVNLRQILKTGVDMPMRPGDIIYLPRKDMVRLEEFVNRITGTISPVLSLYTQAFDAYYADRRNRLLFQNNGNGNGLVNTLQTVRSFIGTGNNNSAALSTLSIISAAQQQQQQQQP